MIILIGTVAAALLNKIFCTFFVSDHFFLQDHYHRLLYFFLYGHKNAATL